MSSHYDDIIDTEYPFELKHMRMSKSDRAAQFSAFQALSGFEAEIHEAARSTDEQVELDEFLKEVLDAKLRHIREKPYEQPLIRIIYFVPDAKKDGGKYMTVLERVKRIDEYTQSVQTVSGLNIPFKDIYELELLKESRQIIMNPAVKNPSIEKGNDKTPDNSFFLITGADRLWRGHPGDRPAHRRKGGAHRGGKGGAGRTAAAAARHRRRGRIHLFSA